MTRRTWCRTRCCGRCANIGGFRGDNARAWLLQVVRHTCFSWLKENRPGEQVSLDDEDAASLALAAPAADEPLATLLRRADRRQINQALAGLPIAYREVLVLRELEELSYADIARIADIPVGTVMSRLSRARGLMRLALSPQSAAPTKASGGHA
jgi:RNA polymerase sigma-70 factor (ECF subfamily)